MQKRYLASIQKQNVQSAPKVKSLDRLNTPNPSRKTLTTSQYFEWACHLRALRQYQFYNAESLSLTAMREVRRSMSVCSVNKAYAQVNA